MGVMDKFIDFMKLNDSEGDDYYDDDDYLDDEEPEKKPSKATAKKEIDNTPEESFRPTKVTPMRPKKITPGTTGMEVCVIKPVNVEDAREITDTLLANRTVVLNMEGIDMDLAQRIIDFTSGSCYAINGNMQKISHYIFIITPASVDISGDFQDILSAGNAFDVPLNKGY